MFPVRLRKMQTTVSSPGGGPRTDRPGSAQVDIQYFPVKEGNLCLCETLSQREDDIVDEFVDEQEVEQLTCLQEFNQIRANKIYENVFEEFVRKQFEGIVVDCRGHLACLP